MSPIFCQFIPEVTTGRGLAGTGLGEATIGRVLGAVTTRVVRFGIGLATLAFAVFGLVNLSRCGAVAVFGAVRAVRRLEVRAGARSELAAGCAKEVWRTFES